MGFIQLCLGAFQIRLQVIGSLLRRTGYEIRHPYSFKEQGTHDLIGFRNAVLRRKVEAPSVLPIVVIGQEQEGFFLVVAKLQIAVGGQLSEPDGDMRALEQLLQIHVHALQMLQLFERLCPLCDIIRILGNLCGKCGASHVHIRNIVFHLLIGHACCGSSVRFVQLVAVQINGNDLLEQILVGVLLMQIDKAGGTGFLSNLTGLFDVEHTAADTLYQRIVQIFEQPHNVDQLHFFD